MSDFADLRDLFGIHRAKPAEETIQIVLALAGGELEKEAFAAWLRNRLSPSPADSRPAGLL